MGRGWWTRSLWTERRYSIQIHWSSERGAIAEAEVGYVLGGLEVLKNTPSVLF